MNEAKRAAALALVLLAVLAVPTLARAGRPTYSLTQFTAADDSTIPPGTLHIRFEGLIDDPLADDLTKIWTKSARRFKTVIFELDSYGGKLNHVAEVVAVLHEMKKSASLTTLVRAGHVCASGCVPVFMQGKVRRASAATAWMFHGGCPDYSNVPSVQATSAYLKLMQDAGLSSDFACHLEGKGYLQQPGEYWLSGYELFYVLKANVITEIIAPWQPESRREPPFEPALRSR
jgi:hypothetical protein